MRRGWRGESPVECSVQRVKFAEGGVVQLVTTGFEMPLLAIDGVGCPVEEPLKGLDDRRGIVGRHDLDGIPSSHGFPPFPQALFIQKYDGKMVYCVLLNIGVRRRRAPGKRYQ